MNRYVIVHPKDGIYLGECLGLGFWSKCDPVGQDAACTFKDVHDCIDYIQTWKSFKDGHINLKELTFVLLQPSGIGMYATIADCVNAGLEAWDPMYSPEIME